MPDSEARGSLGGWMWGVTLLATVAFLGFAPVQPCPICDGKGFAYPSGCASWFEAAATGKPLVPWPCGACHGATRIPLLKRGWIAWRLWRYVKAHPDPEEREVFRY